MERNLAIFLRSCGVCGKEITDMELSSGIVCSNCRRKARNPEVLAAISELGSVWEELAEIPKIEENLKLFVKEFKDLIGSGPWGAQITWAKRVLAGRSFCIAAPPGMGKTAFGMAMARFLAKQGKKSLFVVPTRVLVKQIKERLPEALAYIATSKKAREEFFKSLEEGKFNILVITNQFLAVNFEKLRGIVFDFIFVDDVDAMVKNSKNIEKVLILMGFTERDIQEAYNKIKAGDFSQTAKKTKAVLVVSSASARPKGLRPMLFQVLLGMGLGGVGEGIRNIEDFWNSKETIEEIVKAAKLLGSGGLIFVKQGTPEETLKAIKEQLNRNGLAAEIATGSKAVEAIEKFTKGEAGILIGYAAHYGSLVRGLDLPKLIKYALFFGAPTLSFRITELNSVQRIVAVARILDETTNAFEEEMRRLRGILRNASPQLLRAINDYLQGNLEEPPKYALFFEELASKIEELLKDPEIAKKVLSYSYASVSIDENGIKFEIPDVATYIQASGRTSRLFAGGVTKGLAVVFEDDERLVKGLERAMRWRFEGFSFKEYSEEEFLRLKKELEESRQAIGRKETIEPVKQLLFIVESPNKARTIAKFFGRPSRRNYGPLIAYEVPTGRHILTVVATLGHVFDIIEDRGYYGIKLPEKVPMYDTIKLCNGKQVVSAKLCKELERDKIETVRALRLLAWEIGSVAIATDPDEEGEKIAWDVALHLKGFAKDLRRAEFHEVTPRAIMRALKELREINLQWVKSQLLRRIEDRLIGFKLSEIVSKRFSRPLSAGRVQSPVLKWIVDAYRKRKETLCIFARFTLPNGYSVVFSFPEIKTKREFFKLLGKKPSIEIQVLEESTKELSPPPPFETNTMLQEASKVLGFSATKTMQIAQELFEMGLITYHRTDSTRVSDKGLEVAREYLGDEFTPRKWAAKEGAHECIRPTRPLTARDLDLEGYRLPRDHVRLYWLIFNRFMASQAPAAKVRRVRAKITLLPLNRSKEVEEVVEIAEEGWLKYYPALKPVKITAGRLIPKVITTWHDSEVKLYTSGTIVAEMKRRGIGRPSTYATILQKLLSRGYVIESKKGYLIPTQIGMEVADFLFANYASFVSEERTREMEKKKDAIRDGTVDYFEVLDELFAEIEAIE